MAGEESKDDAEKRDAAAGAGNTRDPSSTRPIENKPAGAQPPENPSRTTTGPMPTKTAGQQGSPAAQPSGLPRIPGVVLIDELGRGGMGVVYRGKQDKLDRMVAVKLLGRDYRGGAAERRFLSESRHLAQLEHKNIVICHDSGITEGGEPYMVMEYVDGPNLHKWITIHGPLAIRDALRVCLHLTRALEHGFERGLIHRDIKGENVLLKPDPHPKSGDFPFIVKIVDFGLSRSDKNETSEIRLTTPGEVIGSPRTMAPEQFLGLRDVDFRVDIYALGCVLFYSLAGEHAFPQDSWEALREAKTHGPVPDVKAKCPTCSPGLARLVRDMIAVDPKSRPHSYAVLLRRFEELLGEAGEELTVRRSASDNRSRWSMTAGIVGGVVALSALVAWGVLILNQNSDRGGSNRGNVKGPVVLFNSHEFTAESGTPFTVTVTARDDSPKPTKLTFKWKLEPSSSMQIEEPKPDATLSFVPPESTFDIDGSYKIDCEVRVVNEDAASNKDEASIKVSPPKALIPLEPNQSFGLLEDAPFQNWWKISDADAKSFLLDDRILNVMPATDAPVAMTCNLPYGSWRMEGSFRLEAPRIGGKVRCRITFKTRAGREVALQLDALQTTKDDRTAKSQLSFSTSKPDSVTFDQTHFVHLEAKWDGKQLKLQYAERDEGDEPLKLAGSRKVPPVMIPNEIDGAKDGMIKSVNFVIEGATVMMQNITLEGLQ